MAPDAVVPDAVAPDVNFREIKKIVDGWSRKEKKQGNSLMEPVHIFWMEGC